MIFSGSKHLCVLDHPYKFASYGSKGMEILNVINSIIKVEKHRHLSQSNIECMSYLQKSTVSLGISSEDLVIVYDYKKKQVLQTFRLNADPSNRGCL